jgi:hypothetical protein
MVLLSFAFRCYDQSKERKLEEQKNNIEAEIHSPLVSREVCEFMKGVVNLLQLNGDSNLLNNIIECLSQIISEFMKTPSKIVLHFTTEVNIFSVFDILSVYLFRMEKALEVCFMFIQFQQLTAAYSIDVRLDYCVMSSELHDVILGEKGLLSPPFIRLHEIIASAFTPCTKGWDSSNEDCFISILSTDLGETPEVVNLLENFEEDKIKIEHVLRQVTNDWQEIYTQAKLEDEAKKMMTLSTDEEVALKVHTYYQL